MNGTIALETDNISYEFHSSLDQCAHQWDRLAQGQIYLSREYLQLVEKSVDGLRAQYYIVKEGQNPIGIVYFQEHAFYALKSFNSFTTKNSAGSLGILRRLVSRLLSFRGIANGNMMLTGPYGFHFENQTPVEKQLKIVDELLQSAIRMANKKHRISLHFVKELDTLQDQQHGRKFAESGFYRFTVQPSMHFHVRSDWESIDDYLASIKSKYRVRYKKARKRGSKLEKHRLYADGIRKHGEAIHDLYLQVIGESAFNLMQVDENYFGNLAEALQEKFVFNAYFLEGKLIGFMSFIDATEILEAHFTGIHQNANKGCDLYLNMLFDLVEESIVRKKTLLNLSRTALEIKSSVGAVPAEMYLYLRHQRPLLNRLLPSIFNFLYKKDEWTQRIPFKDEN